MVGLDNVKTRLEGVDLTARPPYQRHAWSPCRNRPGAAEVVRATSRRTEGGPFAAVFLPKHYALASDNHCLPGPLFSEHLTYVYFYIGIHLPCPQQDTALLDSRWTMLQRGTPITASIASRVRLLLDPTQLLCVTRVS